MDLFEYMRKHQYGKGSSTGGQNASHEPWMRSWGRSILSARTSFCIVPSRRTRSAPSFSMDRPVPGKTTLAKVIANTNSAEFQQTMPQWRAKRIWKKVAKAKGTAGMYRSVQFCSLTRSTVLIKDNRIICSPYVEDGTIILIGATTENPYFEVNGVSISRSVIFELKPIPRKPSKSF